MDTINTALTIAGLFLAIISIAVTVMVTLHPDESKRILKKIKSDYLLFAVKNSDLPKESYAYVVGKNHKYLREQILTYSLREMAEFYGLSSVAELEEYECGVKEFPLVLRRRLEDFFFIKKGFLDGHDEYIFEDFNWLYFEVKRFLDDGFVPVYFCKQSSREHLFTYLVFYKVEGIYSRCIVSNVPGSFSSNGGGRGNIEFLIEVLLDEGVGENDILASILRCSDSEWRKIITNKFYRRFDQMDKYWDKSDFDCQDIFYRWVRELKEKRINKSRKAAVPQNKS